jgi:hypothetical protein
VYGDAYDFNPRIKSGLMIRWKIMGASVKVIGLKSIAIGSHAFVKETFSHLRGPGDY